MTDDTLRDEIGRTAPFANTDATGTYDGDATPECDDA